MVVEAAGEAAGEAAAGEAAAHAALRGLLLRHLDFLLDLLAVVALVPEFLALRVREELVGVVDLLKVIYINC